MCGPAVRAMRAASTRPVEKAARPIVTPPKLVASEDKMDIELPRPANPASKQYTRREAAAILAETKKGSVERGDTMRLMISEGYAPTTERTLQRLMEAKESGKEIADESWTAPFAGIGCIGIHSSKLDELAPANPQYCYDKGWYMDSNMQWHAKGCNDDTIKKCGRCTKCLSAYKNMNQKRHPKLFGSQSPGANGLDMSSEEPDTSSVLPDAGKIGVLVAKRLECIQASEIATDLVLTECAKWLRVTGSDRIDVGNSKSFLVCTECTSHRLCQKRSNNSSLCSKCKTKSGVKAWQQKRREDHFEERTASDSTTPLTSLTKEELTVRGKNLKADRQKSAARLKRMEKLVESSKVDAEISKELLNHLNEALEHATSNQERLRIDIESTLIDLLTEEATKNGGSEEALLTHEDTRKFVDFIAESMRNHIHKVNGNENLYRFSPYLTGLAMNQLISTGTSRFDQWRDESLIVMPSSGNLAQKKHAQKICVGDCIVMYEKQLLLRPWVEEIGELMCDEMKLQEDILFNVMSNKMVGFTENFICKKKILQNFLDDEKLDAFREPAKHVNQWRYRSANGRAYNCEFWFSGDAIDGDTLLEQFIQVVVHCEIIGSRVLGLVCDAGGGNARLFKLLRGMLEVPEGAWLPIDCVRTRNPFDPDRYIYLFHCSTHDLKAMRNALFTSWRVGGKKEFLDENDVQIGKAIIEECFQRDRAREMRNAAPLSEVRETTVILNRHSKMNVSEAKRVFSWKTLAEILAHLYDELKVPTEERLSKEQHGGVIGYMPAAATHLKAVLKKKAPQNAAFLAPKISSFEWLANVHEIFNATLMNTDILITWYNIDRYEAQMKKSLEYFDRMRKKQMERRKEKHEKWELSFLSSKTWLNLRTTCRGFFAYCRALIDYADNAEKGSIPKFCAVSPAHSNSSAIEAWFACTRNAKQDSSISYAAFLGSRDMFKASTALKKNKMYSAKDVGEMSAGRDIGPNELIKFHSGREKKMSDMIHQYDLDKTYQVDAPTPAFSPAAYAMISDSMSKAELDSLRRLAQKVLPKGYLAALLEQRLFRQRLRLSIGTPTGQWFESLLASTLDADGVSQFDDVCQKMMEKIFEIAVDSHKGRKRDDVSFELDLHNFHRSAAFTSLCQKLMPGNSAQSRPGCVVLFLALSRLFSGWLRGALEGARRERNPELFRKKSSTQLTPAEENSEVNRFVGWAAFSAKKTYKTEMASDVRCKELLKAMTAYKREIDDEYMQKYYDPHMSLLNQGGLTLVDKHFFEWGKQLMREIRSAFDEDAIDRDPQHAFENGKHRVMSDEKLRAQFILLCQNLSPSHAKAAGEVYDVFVRKTIHSRFAVVFRRWKEANVNKKGQVAFRTKLKVQSQKKSPKSAPSVSPSNSKGTSAKGKKKRKLEAVPFSDDTAANRKHRREELNRIRREKRMRVESMANSTV